MCFSTSHNPQMKKVCVKDGPKGDHERSCSNNCHLRVLNQSEAFLALINQSQARPHTSVLNVARKCRLLLSWRIIPAVDNQRISTMQTSFSNSNDAWRLWIRINQPGFSDKNYAGGNQFILKEKRYPFSQTGGLFTALSEKYQDCSVYMEGTQPAIHVYHIL